MMRLTRHILNCDSSPLNCAWLKIDFLAAFGHPLRMVLNLKQTEDSFLKEAERGETVYER
jgi:hypothetical protein